MVWNLKQSMIDRRAGRPDSSFLNLGIDVDNASHVWFYKTRLAFYSYIDSHMETYDFTLHSQDILEIDATAEKP